MFYIVTYLQFKHLTNVNLVMTPFCDARILKKSKREWSEGPISTCAVSWEKVLEINPKLLSSYSDH